MNETLDLCFSNSINATYLTFSQLAILTVINVIVMVANVTVNALVIYILIKTNQYVNVACKVILILSISDLLTGAVAQNLFFAVLYSPSCLINSVTRSVSTFSTQLSGYTIAILGVDRFIRIKYYLKVNSILTSRFISALLSIACVLALVSAVVIPMDLLLIKPIFFSRVNLILGAAIISIVAFLQVLVIRTSNIMISKSTIDTFQAVNKKINKLSMRIMLALLFFTTPFLTIGLAKSNIQEFLGRSSKSVLEFIFGISIVLLYANSLVNAILFLSTNMKAKRVLRDFL